MNTQYRHCGKKLSPAELVEFLTDQHAGMVDDSIMLWLSMSLEDMADVVSRAIKCSESDDAELFMIAGLKKAAAADSEFCDRLDLLSQKGDV